METVRLALLFAHFLGLAAVLGGLGVQATTGVRQVSSLMLRGIYAQLVTGVLLVAVRMSLDLPDDPPKYAAKLGIAAVIAVLMHVGRRRGELPRALFATLAVLAAGNVAVAVFWT